MTSIELLVVLSGVGLSLIISILAQFKITQIASSEIAGRVKELNEALGEALTIVGTNAQAENPLLAILSKVLEKQLDNPISASIVNKDESGKFVKKIE